MIKSLQNTKQGKVFILCFLLAFLSGVTPVFSQDEAVIPANDNSKVPWVNGATFGGVIHNTPAGWSDPGNVIDNNTSNFASYNSSGVATHTTSEFIVSNGETYRTKPFTGYRIGVIVSRSASLIGGNITIKTYKDGSPTGESTTALWSIGDTDVGFYAHEEFDAVSVQLSSTNISPIGTQTQNIKQVYLQRYTRFGGGFDTVGNKEATCNAQIPLTGLGLEATGSATILIPIPPFIIYVPSELWFGLEASVIDEHPDTYGTVPFINAGIANYQGYITDLGVLYPAGTYGGYAFKLNLAIDAGINVTKKLRFYREGEVVYEETQEEYLSASSSSENMRVGAVSPEPFDAIGYEFQLNVTATLGWLDIFYPVIQRFCDAEITCNEQTTLIAGEQEGAENHPVYAKAIGTSFLNVSLGNPGIDNVHRVIDSDLNNYATIGSAVANGALYSNYGISVISEQTGGYPAGTFAGFEIEEDNWADASFSKNYIVSTFLDGNLVETYNTQDFLGVDFFTPNQGRHIIGFKSNDVFDEVRLSVEKIGSASALSATKVYRAVIETYCPTDLEALTNCNELINLKRSNGFPVFLDGKNTGIIGVGSGNTYFEDLDNIVSDTTDPAILHTTIGASTTASVAVQDGSKLGTDLYPVGTFAGFDVAFPTIVSGELFGSTITVSLLDEEGNEVHSEVMNSSFFGAHSSILSGTDARQVIGYVAPVEFSGVKLTINKNASVDWGALEIYSAVIQRFCEQDITCEEIERIGNPEHPVYINGQNTGIYAVADGNSSISNSQKAIDGDENTYAEIQLSASFVAEVGFSVANGAYDEDGNKVYYPANTYIGFDFGTQTWFDVNGFYEMKIELLKDGIVLPEGDNSGTQYGAGVSSDIITGGWKRMHVGTVGYSEFDEVRLRIRRLAGATLGELRIYDVVGRNFNTEDCGVYELQCDGSYVLVDSDEEGAIPAVVDFARTGYEGVGSAGFGIDNVWNVVSENPADFAKIHFSSNAVGSASISVAAPGVVFPPGTYAGYTIDKDQWPIAGGFFNGITVTTYLNGEEQESVSDTSLMDFTLLVQWWGTEDDVYTPGFITTLPFNEIQFSVQSIAQLLDHPFSVYGAYVVASDVDQEPGDGTTPVICDVCTKPGAGGSPLLSSVGITTKGSVPSVTGWPNAVPNGYLVLDAVEKGMVITHMTTAQIEALTPVEGMLVYDTDEECVKLYRGEGPDAPTNSPARTGWVCIKRGCNE